MSEEIAWAAGDLAYWRQRAVRAESDVAALAAAIGAYISAGDTQARAQAWRAMRDLSETAHPAGALLAELHAARAVVELARDDRHSHELLALAVANYDEIRKQVQE